MPRKKNEQLFGRHNPSQVLGSVIQQRLRCYPVYKPNNCSSAALSRGKGPEHRSALAKLYISGGNIAIFTSESEDCQVRSPINPNNCESYLVRLINRTISAAARTPVKSDNPNKSPTAAPTSPIMHRFKSPKSASKHRNGVIFWERPF